jgi:hypothetical protein
MVVDLVKLLLRKRITDMTPAGNGQAGQASGAGQADINKPPAVADPGDMWPEGDLPAQGGGFGPTLMPSIDEFIVPQNLAQLWDTVDIKDSNPKSRTFGQVVSRNRLKFDKNAPLIVASGPNKGEVFTCQVSANPRPRGKADDENTPWISDLAYMLEIGFGDKSRPTSAQALKAQINKYAGKSIWIDHGLSAHCRPDQVKYVYDDANPNPDGTPKTMKDPRGVKGCGDDTKKRADGKGKQGRYYTRDFKDPDSKDGGYVDQIECDTVIGVTQAGAPVYCGAALRGFPSLERFVPAPGK